MSRKEEQYIIMVIVVAVLSCVAAWLAIPQGQQILFFNVSVTTNCLANKFFANNGFWPNVTTYTSAYHHTFTNWHVIRSKPYYADGYI